jgi:hypothetical protein
MPRIRLGTAIAGLAVSLVAAGAADLKLTYLVSDDTLLRIGTYKFQGGAELVLNVGIGSGAFHHRSDPPNVIWTIGDRGPNMACDELPAGVKLAACDEVRNGRIYLTPSYTPSIYRVMILADTFRITDVITLKDRSGKPISGLLNPLRTATTETSLDGAGNRLSPDPNGVDAESIVRLADGTFFISEENAPSLAHVGADGRIRTRYVPQGTEAEFAGANYEVKGSLPPILAKRAINRGIESLAISPDERFLYFVMQSPLANPDDATYKQARNTRLFKLDRVTMRVLAEYVYVLDDFATFSQDAKKQNDIRVCDLLALGGERFLVIERTEKVTKLQEITLQGATNIFGRKWDRPETQPTLEQTDLAAAKIIPVSKVQKFDSAKFPQMLGKTEGMARLGDGSIALINDDDFGITGARTQIVVLRGL